MNSTYEYIISLVLAKTKPINNEKRLNEISSRVSNFKKNLSLSEIENLEQLISLKVTTTVLKDRLTKKFRSIRKQKQEMLKQVRIVNDKKAKEKLNEEKRIEFGKKSTIALRKKNESLDDKESTARIVSEAEETCNREKRKLENGIKFYKESNTSATTWINGDPLTPPPTEE